MKTITRILNRLGHAIGAGLLLGSLLPAAAQFASPVGTWDCVVSGSENGIAYLTFNADYTFNGYEVLTPKSAVSSTNENVRGGDDIGRTIEGSVSAAKTNFSGFALISGYWSHDITGKKILGFYTEGNNSEVCTTNQEITSVITNTVIDLGGGSTVTITVTNYLTNDVLSCETEGLTNGLSFTAVVKPGSRISLKAVSPNGNKNLKGVPATAITDLSGSYYGMGKRGRVGFTEFLELEASGEYPNAFDVSGLGPGYELSGIAIASRQKKFGFVYRGSSAGDPLVSLFGSVNFAKYQASLKGFDSNDAKVSYKMYPQDLSD